MRKISDPRVGRQSHFDSEVNAAAVHSTAPAAVRSAIAVAKDYPVFPCDAGTKKPLTDHGFKDATQDTAMIAKWWRRYPEALIGVPTGYASGLLAIDCDPRSGSWYQDHKSRLGAYRLHQTRRGKHLLYHDLPDFEIHNSASEVADGVDVRGTGGYIIWWPAHGGVAIGEPGEMPAWLLDKIVLKRPKVTKLNGDAEPDGRDARKFSDGARNDALSKRAHYYRKTGMSTKEIGAALLKYDLEHCEPPYQLTDGKDKVLYIARKKGHLTSDDQDAKRKAETTEIVLTRADRQDEVGVDWLWKGFLARNKFHLLSGSGGVMKSTLALSLTATITQGTKWPDGTRCPRGNVLIWTGEDDLADTVKPRLRWAGADQTRCWFVKGVREDGEKREFDPARDALALERACEQIGDVSMIVIDPIVVVVQKDNNSASDVRRSLSPLADLAAKYNAVLLGIQHFTKGSKGKDPAERVLGSGAWVHRARIVLAAAMIDEGDGQHASNMVFTCVKTFAKSEGGFEYSFEEEPKTEVARIVWGKRLRGTGHHIITEAEGNGDGTSKLGEAKRILQKELANGVSKPYQQLSQQMAGMHISNATFRRARETLGVKTIQAGKSAFRCLLTDD